MAIAPPRVRPGDTIGIVAPAGPIKPASRADLQRGLDRLSAFNIRLGPTLTRPREPDVPSYLSASDVQRRDGQRMLGLQSWIALPAGSEEIAPSFQHYAADALPTVKESGFTARIIAGSGFGVKSPVSMVSPWFYTEVTAQAGTSVPLDPDHEERAIYLVDGEVEIANERYEGPRLLIFRPGDRITVELSAYDLSRCRIVYRQR